MPLPKRRHSNQRTRKRRTHYKLTPPTLARTNVCPIASQRGGCPVFQYRLDHHACPECGFYDGKQAVAIKEKSEEVE
ncbi:MAG: 50S ribosomal protein L32 [Armatimonadota bacterium]|nr:50S ribosomal protein L32 [Armatimonadota bacterium]